MGMHADLHNGILDTILAAWPEVDGPTHPIFRVTQVERYPWMDKWKSGALASPWIVYQVEGSREAPGMGALNRAYRSRVTVYYICRADATDDGDIAGYVEAKLEALAAEFWAQNAHPAFAHIAGGDFFDTSAENPVNRVFITGQMPYFGGSFSAELLFGEGPSVDGNPCAE